MTYDQTITLFTNIANSHWQLKGAFGHGEAWEIEGEFKPGWKDYVLWAIPTDSTTAEQVKIRTFTLLVFKRIKKGKDDEKSIISDTEQILDDVIKILRNESTSYEVIGDPVLIPFKEEFGDWVAGWRANVQIQTQFNNNYCDVPSDTFVSPELPDDSCGFVVQIKDQNNNVLQTFTTSGTYTVEVITQIIQTLSTPSSTIIQTLT